MFFKPIGKFLAFHSSMSIFGTAFQVPHKKNHSYIHIWGGRVGIYIYGLEILGWPKSSSSFSIKKPQIFGSGQDGGVGRNPLLPRTTKRRITTNLKSINNKKQQKIKPHGTPTNKELKKKSTRTTRLVRRNHAGRLRKTAVRQLRGRAHCLSSAELRGRG